MQEKLFLDQKKLLNLMKRGSLNWTRLSLAVGWSRQLLYYHFTNRTATGALKLAQYFKLDPRKLLTRSRNGGK